MADAARTLGTNGFLAWSLSDMPLYPHLYAIPIIFTVGVAVGWLMRHWYRNKS